ncbi:phage tail protein [Listeria monocytogenes]|uniref:phage tail protein n=1 Tax=Listeria monocytogenes TaxID=1639 RepID=UPI000F134F7F|nr:phage tail protein [Listeria monocytogenes]MCX81740.1 phage tail protein [Listeria monocytogenes]TYU32089.1 phage tail protein [Listeria monocytogenes]
MFGIEFLGKHSFRDYGLVCKEKNIGFPTKNKIKEEVPFSNRVYDFSDIYGSQTYSERTLTYTFFVYDELASSIEAMTAKKIEAVNWLSNSLQEKLYDDDIEGYYFLAEATSIDFPEQSIVGQLKVTFTAYPFKIRDIEEGSDIWDTFNFTSDYAQSTTFFVSGMTEVELYNPGITEAAVKVEAGANMTITKDNNTFKVPAGASESDEFYFTPGINKFSIAGYGKITFHFNREVL